MLHDASFIACHNFLSCGMPADTTLYLYNVYFKLPRRRS
jgi:hypothetical protein